MRWSIHRKAPWRSVNKICIVLYIFTSNEKPKEFKATGKTPVNLSYCKTTKHDLKCTIGQLCPKPFIYMKTICWSRSPFTEFDVTMVTKILTGKRNIPVFKTKQN